MRKSYPSYSLITLSGLVFAGSCSIIAEVDRTKIPQDGTPSDGGQSTGGTAGTSGTAGGGTGGTPMGGTSGDAGGGGEPSGGTTAGGTGGDAGGGMGGAGMGGAGDAGGGVGGDPGPECGNGETEAPETCDDGDMPPASGDGCDDTCTEEPGWNCTGRPSNCIAAACGDRIQAGAEQCDDGNVSGCGTCSMTCGANTPSARATGSITLGATAPADIADGDYFTLNDGLNTTPTEFEFDLLPADNGITRAGAIEINVDTSQTDAVALRAAIVAAINGVTTTLLITAGGTGAPIVLTNDNPGTQGNQTTGDFVTATSFTISTTMSGGAAHDCPAGTGCAVDADCLNGDCVTTTNLCN
jgi:cysteine-rich repeat protein